MDLVEHIGIFNNALEKDKCNDIINFFEAKNKERATHRRQESARQNTLSTIQVNDTAYSLFNEEYSHMLINDIFTPITPVMGVFWNCFDEYSNYYGAIKESARHMVLEGKLQRTDPREGYHTWHYEKMTLLTSRRLAAFMFYLNDVEEGGETEFLYQSIRFKPTTGTLLIWPASYTHTHRGNPPLSGTKYIYTGWVEYVGG